MNPSVRNWIGAAMTRRWITLFALLCSAMSIGHGQEATERYIPLGQSPGVSGKTTLIGSVGAVDSAAGSMAVQSGAGAQPVKLTPKTRIWLDRSAARQSTLAGTIADLRPGRRVEVKFADERSRSAAEWIKVDAGTPP
jgi:hypothetical protein